MPNPAQRLRAACAWIAALAPLPVAPAVAAPMQWQPEPPQSGSPTPPLHWQTDQDPGPLHSPVFWQQLPDSSGSPGAAQRWEPVWEPLPADAPALGAQAEPAARPRSAAEAETLLNSLAPTPNAYQPLLRIGQLPTATLRQEGGDEVTFQQVSPGSGGAAGGTGNQNYGFRADLVINRNWTISAYYTYADDPLFAPITVRPSQPANLWTVYGAALRTKLANWGRWTWAGEGALELFTVGSGCGGSESCEGPGTPNIFNNSGQKVFTRNIVGALSLPLSWQASPQLQLSFVPAVSFLPDSQGTGQGGAGTFYGTNVSLGVGANYRIAPQMQLFGSAMVPLGPGTNAFDGSLSFSRVPILTAGTQIAVNPRIGLEASITNGFGLSPATAILALPSAPDEPLLSVRFVWTPVAQDSANPGYTRRQASFALGGVTVNTALTPVNGTTQLWLNADSAGNVFGAAGYSVSNDFQFQIAGGQFSNIEPRNSYVNTFAGNKEPNLRFGGKVMVLRPSKGLPLWAGARVTVGRAGGSQGQGYLFAEQMNTWEATPNLALNLNPKVALSGNGTSFGVGLSANLQLGTSFQLIPELNLVTTELSGTNGSNGTLALRWLAAKNAAFDLYASNAGGLLDLGQLLNNEQLRVGGRLQLSF